MRKKGFLLRHFDFGSEEWVSGWWGDYEEMENSTRQSRQAGLGVALVKWGIDHGLGAYVCPKRFFRMA